VNSRNMAPHYIAVVRITRTILLTILQSFDSNLVRNLTLGRTLASNHASCPTPEYPDRPRATPTPPPTTHLATTHYNRSSRHPPAHHHPAPIIFSSPHSFTIETPNVPRRIRNIPLLRPQPLRQVNSLSQCATTGLPGLPSGLCGGLYACMWDVCEGSEEEEE
jgi:hypothetical protein